jgi:outer membrane protein assembly factor BamB
MTTCLFHSSSARRLLAAGLCMVLAAPAVQAQWTQWGGPHRDFTVEARGLAEKWPDTGPRQLWKRALGDGYASILVENGILYTMYRAGNDEFTIALRAADGSTIWEHKNPSPFTKTMAEFGPGPHATPLLVENRLYSIGTNGVLHALDKADGRVLWKHDLIREFDGELRARGYSCSPLAYKDLIILPLGSEGSGPGALAFDQSTGRVAWKSPTFRATYAAPLLIRFQGEDQLVLFMASELVGVNPNSGEVLWTAKHSNQTFVNASTPVWDGKDTLFCANAYDGGARAFHLSRDAGKTIPRELWFSSKMKLHHGNALLIGENIYASSGSGTAFFMGLKLETGDVLFRERGFKKATALYADEKLILLDEDGQLALAKLTPDGINILSRCEIAEPYAWAAPTLTGTTLYVRDRRHILALDLGK